MAIVDDIRVRQDFHPDGYVFEVIEDVKFSRGGTLPEPLSYFEDREGARWPWPRRREVPHSVPNAVEITTKDLFAGYKMLDENARIDFRVDDDHVPVDLTSLSKTVIEHICRQIEAKVTETVLHGCAHGWGVVDLNPHLVRSDVP